MSKLTILGALLALGCVFVNAAPAGDLVNNLPGLNFKPNFLHYSGYLQGSSDGNIQLHYWFVKHQYASASSPVILWLNGGPGCSSLGGLIEENGPFHVMDNGNTVYENVYAWNKVGHVIYLESPAGVGFSYSKDGNIETDDDKTAKENYNALVDFFTNKFPEYKNQPFFITGESYGGVYIPTLAVLVAADKTNFPQFKGVAIGNGILQDQFNWNTLPALYFYHGIMRQSLYDTVAKQCCNGNPYNCDYADMSGSCGDLVDLMLNQANDLDPYNIYAVCYLDGGSTKKTLIRDFLFRRKDKDGNVKKRNRQLGAALPLCAQVGNTATYLNRQDVRAALHIPSSVGTWSDCNDLLNELFYQRIYSDMSTQVKQLISQNIRVLIYNGDVDTVCNVIMNEKFVNALNIGYSGEVNNRVAWHYNGSVEQMQQCCDFISNVAGYVTKYNGVDFVTVRGSGHFVPGDKPREALQMIYNYVSGVADYSTPVPFSTQPQPPISG